MALALLSSTHSSLLILTVVTIFVGGAAAVFLLAGLRLTRREPGIQHIPGPVKDASWLYGNLPELLLTQPYGKSEFKWNEQYGPTYRIKGCFSEDLLFTSDSAALRFVLNEGKLFDLSPNRRFMVLSLLGEKSMLGLRNGGEAHRRVKNTLSPAFTPSRLHSCVPVMRDSARKVTEKIMHRCSEEKREHDSAAATVDMYHLFQQLTSDIIGEVGFGYKFNALETDGRDKLVQSHQNVVILGSRRSKTAILVEGVIPHLPRTLLKFMSNVPTSTSKTLKNFLNLTETWITAWLAESLSQASDSSHATNNGVIGSATLSSNNQKRESLSYDSIRDQTPTLLLAGTDTTTNALAFAFYELAKRPVWQDQIRKEILEAQKSGGVDSDLNLDKLDCLNAHIKETLRLHPTVPLSERVAFENTVLPLSQPVTTSSGRVITELPIVKGQTVHLGLASYNRDPHVWGADASLFDPMRWLDGRYDSANLPGIGPYSNLVTFLSGVRVCLGWRLGLLDMQVVLSELIPKFKFGFDPEQEKNVVAFLALNLMPMDIASGKPGLTLLVQPIQSQEN